MIHIENVRLSPGQLTLQSGSQLHLLRALPGDSLCIVSPMTVKPLIGHGHMLIGKPTCPGVWPIWVVWEHEDSRHADKHSHDAVDHKEPAELRSVFMKSSREA